MTSLKQFEIQQQIKENSQGLVNTINELHKWEKDIKSRPSPSSTNSQTKKYENSYPIRSHKENGVSNGHPTPAESQTTETNRNDVTTTATEYKDLGNKFVKSNDYTSAIQNYTKAIGIEEDPVFYSNRAFCYLKLEQYNECIDDCTKAVQLDPKLVKGFYRRMQANEVLSNFNLALKDCKEVLKLDPKNTDAIHANRRLTDRLAGKNLSPSPSTTTNVLSWSKLDASVKDVAFMKKPPHLRSKKPLRRIQINEPLPASNCTPPDKKSKDEENEAFKSADVGADQSAQTGSASTDKVVAVIPSTSPMSTAQFYRTWRELADDSQKYSYLKIIDVSALNKLLGTQFTSEMLKDLLKVLSENFVSDKLPVGGILKQIVVNGEFKILKMFMDTEDKNAFEKLIKYLESSEPNTDALAFIKDKYFN